MALSVPLADRINELRKLDLPQGAEAAGTEVPPQVRQAADEALLRGETHYTDRPGILALREKVADSLNRRYGLEFQAQTGVVITCGVTEARFVAVQQLLPRGGTLVALSGAEHVSGASTIRDVRVLPASEADQAVPADAALFLDTAVEAAVARKWLERARDADWPIIVEAVGEGSFHPAELGLAEQCVTIGAIGNSQGMESWRLGFLAAPEARTGPLRDFKQALTICTTNVSQWGALALEEADI